VYFGARVSALARDSIIRPALVFVLLASALKLLGVATSTLGAILLVLVVTAVPLWGAVDATTRRQSAWERAGRSRTFWVALQGIGAPFGVGLLGSIAYFAGVRRQVVAAAVVAEEAGAVAG